MKNYKLLIASTLIAILLIPLESMGRHRDNSSFSISFGFGPSIGYYQNRNPYVNNYGYGYNRGYPVIVERRYYNDYYSYYRNNNFYNHKHYRGHHRHWR